MGERVALVTGAAGGIGTAVARALADDGWLPALLDRAAGPLDVLGRELGADVLTFGADVTDPAGVAAAVARIEAAAGPIEVLVCAAGVLRPASVVETTDADWAHSLAVNAGGVLVACRAVAPRMVERGRGSVVVVASDAAGVPRVGMAAYAASKAAAVALTRCLGLELARSGVRANVVCPGATDTAMQRLLWPDPLDPGGVGRVVGGSPDRYRIPVPLGRIADPADVAEAVRYLASDRARHVTMQAVYVDGGASLGTR